MFAVTILKSNIKRDPWPLISDPLPTYLPRKSFEIKKITLQNTKIIPGEDMPLGCVARGAELFTFIAIY